MVTRVIASPNTAEGAVAAALSDTVAQTVPFRALWIGTTGDVSVGFSDGTSYTFKNVPVGMLPVGGIRVNNTNTTALNIGCVY